MGESDEELRASAKFLAEARITHRLRHPNVVQVHGAVKQPLSIVMEYMQGGSLFDLLHKSKKACPRRSICCALLSLPFMTSYSCV